MRRGLPGRTVVWEDCWSGGRFGRIMRTGIPGGLLKNVDYRGTLPGKLLSHGLVNGIQLTVY